MSIKNFLLFSLSLLILGACDNEVIAKFEITNNTRHPIDSISIITTAQYTHTKYINLLPKQTEIFELDMRDIPKADGDYILRYLPDRTHIYSLKNFGYYTNGYPIEKLTKIRFERDSIVFDMIY